jgi:hypothetical protein
MKKVITTGRFTKVYESNGRFTKVYIGEGGGRFTKVHEANGDTLLVPQQEHRADRADRGQNDPMTLADLAHKLGVNPRTIPQLDMEQSPAGAVASLAYSVHKARQHAVVQSGQDRYLAATVGERAPCVSSGQGEAEGQTGLSRSDRCCGVRVKAGGRPLQRLFLLPADLPMRWRGRTKTRPCSGHLVKLYSSKISLKHSKKFSETFDCHSPASQT